jgi:xanthine dehydrogenase YagS FAD-binding subunit
VAAALELDERGERVIDARLALGGVAHKPWRASLAEDVLRGAPATDETFRLAAEAELKPAVGREYNAFKIELARRVIVNALQELTGRSGVQL